MIDKGQCKICGGWYRLEDNGRLPEHFNAKYIDSELIPCRGRWPKQPDITDYTTGWDHDPREYYGGLPERDRRKF